MRRRWLAGEIGLALALKAAALVALYFAFFSTPHRQYVTPEKMAAFLSGRDSAAR